MQKILCGPVFKDLPVDLQEKANALYEVKETLRIFYKMLEKILTLKEEEEKSRQVAVAAVN